MGNRLSLNKLQLTTEWQEYLVPPKARTVELTGTQTWAWSTKADFSVTRSVGAFVREVIFASNIPLFPSTPGEVLLWFKGEAEGEIYEKITN